jgi:hypothetical protein
MSSSVSPRALNDPTCFILGPYSWADDGRVDLHEVRRRIAAEREVLR